MECISDAKIQTNLTLFGYTLVNERKNMCKVETNHHYNINRDYDPITGRYTQSDPVGFKGGVNTYGYAEANPVMKKDETGLWSSGGFKYFTTVHQIINGRVWGNTWAKRILDRATVTVDRYQSLGKSYLHAMRGKGRSMSLVRAQANHHVKTGFGVARTYANRGDYRRAYDTFGWALHTLQDSTSPAHRGFQRWSGGSMWNPFNWPMLINHFRKEGFSWQINSAAMRTTRWSRFLFDNRRVPYGDVFIY